MEKKRKRRADHAWEEKWLVRKMNNQAECLICGMTICGKKYNVERHYNTRHESYHNVKGAERVTLLNELKSSVTDCEAEESSSNQPAKYISYKIAHAIAQESRSFSSAPFIKQCLEIAAESVCPTEIAKFKAIKLSPRTVARRVEELSEDLVRQLKLKVKAIKNGFTYECNSSYKFCERYYTRYLTPSIGK